MRTVRLGMNVPSTPAGEVYRILADFERYPRFSSAVRDVLVLRVSDTVSVSKWEVTFRSGILRWTEEDRFDPATLTISFHQLEGDVAVFDGTWQCADGPDGCELTFAARLDMGIPSLADALEPIAVRTLVENTVSIVSGLVGTVELTSSEVGVDEPARGRS